MTAKLIAVGADQSPAEAHALMVRNRVHHLPVVDGAGRLVGMISRDGVAVGLGEDESEVRSAIVGIVRSCGGSIVALDVCEGVVRLHARVADACAARGLERRVRVTPGVRVLIPTVECGGELSARGSHASHRVKPTALGLASEPGSVVSRFCAASKVCPWAWRLLGLGSRVRVD